MANKMKFITIGYIEWRKGQDLLVDAIEGLPEDIASSVEFVLVGQKTSQMARELEERISSLNNVTMVGTVPRDEIHKLLDEADLLICPSREDPMPTVCAEAMMHKVPCLVSDATGTAAYIKDGIDGMVFESESVEVLRDKILWCIEHPDELMAMGSKAYALYKEVFAEEVFEGRLLDCVAQMIGGPRM